MGIGAVIFDLDGTITQPYFDFDAIRAQIGLPMDSGPVLESMAKMKLAERARAERILHYHEQKAVEVSQLNPGARETVEALRQLGIRVGVLTRNRKANAVAVARKHSLQFDAIVGREDGPVKPDAYGVLALCERFQVQPAEAMVVGDYLFDMLCAKAAGAVAVLLLHGEKNRHFAEYADYCIDRIEEVLDIIEGRSKGSQQSSGAAVNE